MPDVKIGWRSGTVPSLLDTYTGAVVAYSLRKLRNAHSGFAIRVRRSSDNTEQNIGFTATGVLDTTALLSFVGAGNGFVTTWYDQSGNSRNAYQTTASYQPFIVNAGEVVTNGGKPAIRNTANGGFLIDNVSIGATNSMYAVIDFGASAREYFGTFGNSWAFYQPNGEYKANNAASGSTNAAFSLNRFIGSLQRYGGKMQYYSNSNTLGSEITLAGSATAPFILGNLIGEGYGYGFIGDQQEAIVYDKDMRTSRASIESGINSYYGIYAPTVSDSDAQAFLNAALITNQTQADAVNTLVTSLKTAGVWTKMMALYPFVGGTSTSHKWNLKDPRDLNNAFRLRFNGGWTHTATGALPNGTNAFAETFLATRSWMSGLDSLHISFYSRTDVTSGGCDIGSGQHPVYFSSIYSKYNNAGTISTIASLSSDFAYIPNNNPSNAFYLVNRNNISQISLFRNSTKVSLTNLTRNYNSDMPFTISALNQGQGTVPQTSDYSSRESAFASIGYGLTDAESIAFYNAIQAFQTTLGRAV